MIVDRFVTWNTIYMGSERAGASAQLRNVSIYGYFHAHSEGIPTI